MNYDVKTGLYEGPLSLMVELAKHRLLDVFLVKIQALTAQYLELVKGGSQTLDQLAEPLPLLGQLVALKAHLLLPQPPVVEEEELPVSLDELQRRLKEYEQFKTVSQVLAQLHSLQHEYLTRKQPADRVGLTGADRVPDEPVPLEVGLLDLMSAFARVLEKAKSPVYEVQEDAWTVEMKVEELTVLLTVKKQIGFHDVFNPEKTKLELVVTFLALLELVRRRLCSAIQERPFGEIVISRRE